MKILLTSLGTQGDFFPILKLAVELRLLGHTVTLAANVEYKSYASKERIDFFELKPSLEIIEKSWSRIAANDSINFIIGDLLLPCLEENYFILLDLEFDVLINHPYVFSGPIAAEKKGKKWYSIALTPFGLFTPSDPPLIPSLPMLKNPRRNQGWFYRIIFFFAEIYFSKLGKPIQKLRQKQGLIKSNKNPVLRGQFSKFGTLALFSSVFAASLDDWPSNTQTLGFPLSDHKTEQTPLNLPEHHLLLALGSSWNVLSIEESMLIVNCFIKVSNLMGVEIVIIAGSKFSTINDQVHTKKNIHVLKEASYHEVLKNTAVIVHSAGIGVIAEATAAGTFQVSLPLANDQFDNANRIQNLGIGISINRNLPEPAFIYQSIKAGQSNNIIRRKIADRIKSENFNHQLSQFINTNFT